MPLRNPLELFDRKSGARFLTSAVIRPAIFTGRL